MTCRDLWPEGITTRSAFRSTAAVFNMRSLAFVGIFEHYAASVCMLRFQLFLPLNNCNCRVSSDALQLHHERHNVPTHDAELLSDHIKLKVAKLSRGDWSLYRAARDEFMRRIKFVEAQLGYRILCTKRPWVLGEPGRLS
ncbi:unnamed protein product [Durusdinium trenchii]|uniref:Uncharacterized protein n=2 Tax=Durusdinium trenchii TaxID=1381693 RepID=A0ABP0PT08_9DINO